MTALLAPAPTEPDLGLPAPPEDDPAGQHSSARVRAWATAVEAGVLARAARLDPTTVGCGSASEAELLVLEELGARARQEFVAANLGLVRRVVASSVRAGEAYADLVQEGCLGLIVAVERFDHRRGVRFSTYATYWIRAYVAAAAARLAGAVTVPVGRTDQLRLAHGVESELAQELGRLPSAAEVGAVLGRDGRWTADLLAQRSPRSVDELDEHTLHRLSRAGTAAPTPSEESSWARRLLAGLDGFERAVVELRLGFRGRAPASRPEVARQLGVPVGRVRRAEVRAFEQLRGSCPHALLEEVAS